MVVCHVWRRKPIEISFSENHRLLLAPTFIVSTSCQKQACNYVEKGEAILFAGSRECKYQIFSVLGRQLKIPLANPMYSIIPALNYLGKTTNKANMVSEQLSTKFETIHVSVLSEDSQLSLDTNI